MSNPSLLDGSNKEVIPREMTLSELYQMMYSNREGNNYCEGFYIVRINDSEPFIVEERITE